jgi:hypothetical protein
MSKISLTPNANGTGVFTVASPNSNTDRTLTLPDESGDFVLSASGVISNFTSTGIDDNATSTAITIDSSQNVSIGANTAMGSTTRLTMANAGPAYQHWQNTTSTGTGWTVGIGSSSALEFFSSTGALGSGTFTERMRIDSSGNVSVDRGQKIQWYDGTIGSGNVNAAIEGTGDPALKLYTRQSGTSTLTERMRLDALGNVGIGTSSPSTPLANVSGSATGLTVEGAVPTIAIKDTSASDDVSYLYQNANDLNILNYAGGSTIFTYGSSYTEAMRINSSGDLLVGQTTSSGRLTVRSAGSTSGTNAVAMLNSSGTGLFYIRGDGAFNTGGAAQSPYFNTSATAANLVVNSSGFLERSTSSARYKENIRDYDQSISIDALRPVFFNSKKEGDSKTYAGLIAEEVHDAGFTEFVEYNDDGEPDAVFYANMVALCIKEIQELKAEVAALKGA